MQVHITGRRIKLTPAINEYVHKKLEKARRFLDHLIWAQVILEVTKTSHTVEIVMHTSGRTFTAKEEGTDLYSAIDLASDKLDEQLRRFKEKRRERRGAKSVRKPVESPDWMMSAQGDYPEVPDPRISSMRSLRLSPSTVNAAIGAMDRSDSAHWIFLNERTQRMTVVYRKPDKTYGVVEAIA